MTASGLGGLLVVTALAFLLPGASAAPASLSPGPTTFRIEAQVRAMPEHSLALTRCPGPAALLAPGVTRCLVFQVHNTLDRPIQVQALTMGLDPDFPPPPSGCSAEKLSLPSFSGALQVPAGGRREAPGLPIQLKNTATNQDDCRETVLHFTFAGTATYADSSSTAPDHHQLSVTGAALGGLLLAGGVLVSAGLALLAVARRRRAGASL